jgi:hypothetical protein
MEINRIIKGCLVTELAVASIYSRFKDLFSQETDFWEDLYRDEKRHISFLIEAADGGRFDETLLEDSGFSMPLLDRTQKFIATMSYHIEINPVSLEDALKIALEIEQTKVEAFTNELIANLSPADNDAFLKILMEERTHIAKIEDMMIRKGFLKLS